MRLLIEAGADVAAHDGYVMRYAGEVPNNKAIVSRLVLYAAYSCFWTTEPTARRRMRCSNFLLSIPNDSRYTPIAEALRHHQAGT